MPRFVVLRHETPPGYPRPTHYDLMLEQSGVLWTWVLESLPKVGGEAVRAERLADHRLDYLEYEGNVSGGRGKVIRVDGGNYDSVPAGAVGLAVRLQGRIVRGVLILSPSSAASGHWRACLSSEQDAGEPPSTVRCLEPQEARGVAADADSKFAELAEHYCALIERHRSIDRQAFLGEVHALLPRLYSSALVLPGIDAAENEAGDHGEELDTTGTSSNPVADRDRADHADWHRLFTSLGALLGDWDCYRKVFDPYKPPSESEVTGTLADDLSDIYGDLKAGLRKWQRGECEAAAWDWRFGFEYHWGRHLVGALQALYVLSCTYELGWPNAPDQRR